MAIHFTCPHCGCETNVDEKYAGQTGPCKECGEPVTIPGNQFAAPPTVPQAPAKTTSTGWVPVLAILGVVAVVGFVGCGVLVALLLPAVQAARGAARRNQCANNVRQIGLALINYESVYGRFPPAYLADENGTPMHSWRVLILPFLEENGLYDQYDFDKPWDSPENLELTQYCPPAFRCPSDATGPGSTNTSYLGIEGPGMFFDGTKARKIGEIKDGTSRTIMVAEVENSAVHWSQPVDLDTTQSTFTIGSGRPNEIGSSHRNGANVVYSDCHITFVATGSMPPESLKAECTIAGGE